MGGTVILEVLSPLPLTKREDGQKIFELWKVHLPELLPDFYGNWEPIDRVFNPQEIDAVLDHWKWPLFATKASPSLDASVLMRKGAIQQHATVIFRIDLAAAQQEQLLAFLKSASITLRADFACVHLLTPTELERGRKNKTVRPLDKQGKRLFFFLASKDLRQRLPELYWATIFGERYAEMFGRDRLLTTPGFSIEALPNGAAFLQLTEELTDVAKRTAAFEDARARAKAYLGQDAFFQSDVAEEHVYHVPHFEFV